MNNSTRDIASDRATAKPTLKTVARMTGFAITTVSRALANDPQIASATRKTIAEAAASIGYLPDRAAQRLRTGRTNVISLVLDPHSEILGFGESLITGIAEVLHGTKYHLTITQYRLGEDPLIPIRYIVRNKLADGVLFARTEPHDARVAMLIEENYPFVTHGRTALGQHSWVDYDNDEFAFRAVLRLAEKGRRHVGIVPPPSKFSFREHMLAGFARGLAHAGITGNVMESADLSTSPEELSRLATAWFNQPDRPDGFICPGEIPTMAIYAAIFDSGLHIGKDIDLIAKKTSPVFDMFRPKIEMIKESIEVSGRDLARALLAQLSGEPAETLQILQAPTFDF